MKASESGPWTVHAGTVVTPDGVTQVAVINDGETELVTSADLVHLISALMVYLEIRSIGPWDEAAA